ncbi:glycine receptor subunit alpha-1-like [Homarus americanus]|uniref:glycine receptor subunit alpha-1-like n=1 Tax=Homarus americanus TaxID=6706 RepID=UPI001C44F3BC|nr:glycine receptor subunit alpha-1-like [Homarus americanus]
MVTSNKNVDERNKKVTCMILRMARSNKNVDVSNKEWTSTPQVSYIKALDVFMIVCIVFVFLTLLEYSVLLSKRRSDILRHSTSAPGTGIYSWFWATSSNVVSVRTAKVPSPPVGSPEESYEMFCARVDRVAITVIPLSFVLFNFIYWPYYLSQRDVDLTTDGGSVV